MIWVGRMTRTDMAKGVDHAEIGENATAGHDILEQRGLDAENRTQRGLGMNRRQT